MSRRRLLAILWLRCGEALAARTEAQEAFSLADRVTTEELDRLYAAWVQTRNDYVTALERYAKAAHACLVVDVEGQIKAACELGGCE